jgi:hypothetical protein
MGLRNIIRNLGDQQAELTYFFELGCQVMGTPAGGYWRCKPMERLDRIAAGRKEQARRDVYPLPTRDEGYYSQTRKDGSFEQFIGPNGDITAERPHVHVIHNVTEGQIIFAVTHSDGSHGQSEYLPIDAAHKDVNAKIKRLRRQLT